MNLKVIKNIILLIIIFLPLFAFPQSFPYINYTTKEGLSNMAVWYIYQDKMGYMWFVTRLGLSRFDGITFHNYTTFDGIFANSTTKIVEGSDSTIYISSMVNINTFKEDKFLKYEIVGNMPQEIIQLKTRNDTLFFIENRKTLSYITNHKIQHWFLDSTILNQELSKKFGTREIIKLFLGSESNIFLYGSNGIFNVQNHEIKKLNIEGLKESSISTIAEDSNKNLWLGASGKVYVVNNFKLIKTIDFETDAYINEIFIDSRGIAWFGVFNRGLYYLKDDKIYKAGENINIKNGSVSNIIEDKQGNIWAAVSGRGVFCFNNLFITNYFESDGLSNNSITHLLIDAGSVKLIGTTDGLNVLKNDNFKKINIGSSFGTTNYIQGIKKGLYNNYLISLGTGGGASQMLTKNIDNLNYILSPGVSTCQSDSLTYFLGYGNSVEIIKQSGFKFQENGSFNVLDNKDATNTTSIGRIIKGKDGAIWIGTNRNLFYKIGAEITSFANDSVLKSGIYTIKIDNNNKVWVTSVKGLAVIFPDHKIISYGKTAACDFNNSTSISFDNSNNVWVGNLKGLYRISVDSILNNNISGVITFDEKNGLPSSEVRAVDFDSLKNELWVGTWNGLTKMELNNLDKYLNPPPKVIIKNIQLRDTTLLKLDNLVFKPYQNNIKINFVSTNYRSPRSIKYEYKLGDENTEWVNTENSNIELASLSPGDYNFQIRAKDNNFTSEITSLKFTLKPPFTKTLWFYSILILIFLAIIYFIAQKRIKFIKHKADEYIKNQNSISELRHQALSASMNPHFIFNTLNSIQAYMSTHDKDEAAEYLVNFSRLIRLNLDLAGQTFIPLETEIYRLELYLKYEKIRFEDMLNYKINIDNDINMKSLLIPNMILQPFVENSIWHGILPKDEPGNISINISKENLLISKNNVPAITIDILDDGVGLNAVKSSKPTHTSKGISLIKERLKLLAGSAADFEYVKIRNREKGMPGVSVLITLFPNQYVISA